MKFTVERNWVEVVGYIWMPNVKAAQRIKLSGYDMHNIGEPTRENVEHWLSLNAGDFSEVTDFSATIGETVIPWTDEENELTYFDCLYGEE